MVSTAEIIVVGSEFFSPLKVDSNSLWLTEQLERRGVRVLAKHVLADDLPTLTQAFREALHRVDLVIATGGLGPTEDDRTREAVAAACQRPLARDPAVLEELAAKFARRGREMTPNNARQADRPEGAQLLPNAQGTAPGFWLQTPRAVVVVLPGPPREMKPLFELFVQHRFQDFSSQRWTVQRRLLKVIGLGESDMDSRIADLYRELENPEVTINFTPLDLEIHLTARAESSEQAQALLDPLVLAMAQRLRGHLFSVDGETLAEVVWRALRERGVTVAFAESLTGGLAAHRLAAVPGASEVLRGGVVAYTEAAKQLLLGVSEESCREHGVVSEQVAREMAEGVSQRLRSTLALACTGYAGPGGGTDRDPVGTAYLALHHQGTTETRRLSVPGDRELVQSRVAQAMHAWIFEVLQGEIALEYHRDLERPRS